MPKGLTHLALNTLGGGGGGGWERDSMLGPYLSNRV